ncbi:MAG: methyl-accepting chemotaxis protein [Clostridiales bacterium]|jgi:methyl-accepting chemotaxis protein|nr:methyl-accepting chemotaxis protein [Clostridiales bacterium]
MFTWYKNSNIKKKLYLAFGVLIALTISLSLISIISYKNSDNSYANMINVTIERTEILLKASGDFSDSIYYRAMAVQNCDDPATYAQYLGKFSDSVRETTEGFDDYRKLLTNDATVTSAERESRLKMFEDMNALLTGTYAEMSDKILAAASSGDKAAASAMLFNDDVFNAYSDRIDETLNDLSDMAMRTVKDRSVSLSGDTNQHIIWLSVYAVVIIAVSIGAAIFISDNLKRRAAILRDSARAIAGGELNANIPYNYKDEIGDATESVRRMQETLVTLFADINAVTDGFQKGDFDTRIDASKYGGDYTCIAKAMNNILQLCIDDNRYMAGFIQEIGVGKFDGQLRTLPGKRGETTAVFGEIQRLFKRLMSELNRAIDGARNGDLSVSADISGFQGNWGNLINGVNELLAAFRKPIRETMSALDALAEGNTSYRMTDEYGGEFGEIKETMNNTAARLGSYIDAISKILGDMAALDISGKLSGEYVGDFSAIKGSINSIVERFQEVVHEVLQSSENVALGSGEISRSATALATGATEQVAHADQLNITVNLMSDKIIKNAEAASEAEKLVSKATATAETGSGKMRDLLEAMHGINSNAANISRIIKVIDDIAFQTNILALNAAVEAARAGAHGKGFSVVAEEVRNLAGKSQQAAKETAELIENSVSTINAGGKLADDTANALYEMISEITAVSRGMAEVSAACAEQSVAIAKINSGMNSIAAVTQSNSATSEEQAAACEELAAQADALKALVGRFELGGSRRGRMYA